MRASRNFYAAQSPRGFANEVVVHSFRSARARDAWVAEHADDGGANSAYCGAYIVSARRARAILNYRGDAATMSYNGCVQH